MITDFSETVAAKLDLPMIKSTNFHVTLGDSSKVGILGLCKVVPLTIDRHTFLIDCHIFPLRGIDLVLGVSWLSTPGNVMANWLKLTMSFSVGGVMVQLYGDLPLTRRACMQKDINLLESSDDVWLLWALTSSSTRSELEARDTLMEGQRSELEALLAKFPAITSPLAGLPPSRDCDHRIVLQAGAGPISIRPYRYNHAQQDEMEKLVGKMLSARIICPSSSSVLLVRKDGS